MAADEKPDSNQEKQEPEEAPLNRAERRARARRKKPEDAGEEHHAPTMKEIFSRKRSPFSNS
jgi:hypothetical protein